MGPNAVQDWLQVGAGLCAVFGVFFLSTGLFSQEDRDFFAPGLTAIAGALYSGYAGYRFAIVSLPPPLGFSRPLFMGGLVSLGILFGLVVGYFIGRRLVRVRIDLSGPRANLLYIIIVALISCLGVALIYLWLWVSTFLYLNTQDAAFLARLWAVPAVASAFFFFCAALVRAMNSRGLKALGLAFTFVSIVLVLIPPIADLLGTPIK
jgi:hypothetical protein